MLMQSPAGGTKSPSGAAKLGKFSEMAKLCRKKCCFCSKDLSFPQSGSRDEGKKAATNGDQAMPEWEKGIAFFVGSGRGRYWQRPLPIMAAGGKNNGSGRCLPC
ncbi:MAG: hypothetical protein IJ243_00890 [Prevotella sp.]|nr:hypothetical protein [Prevotella sp.]